MTSRLVNAIFSLPEWQAVKMIFFAPWAGPRTLKSQHRYSVANNFNFHKYTEQSSFIELKYLFQKQFQRLMLTLSSLSPSNF